MMDIVVGTVISNQIPENADVAQREILAGLLANNIPFRVVECNEAITIDQCEAVGNALEASLVKTLFVCNRQRTRFHLVSMPGYKPFVTTQFTAGRGVSRVSFVSSDKLMGMLSTPVGGAGPFSISYDKDGQVEMVVDRELEKCEWVALPVLSPNMYVAVRMSDILEKYIPATGHSCVLIDMV